MNLAGRLALAGILLPRLALADCSLTALDSPALTDAPGLGLYPGGTSARPPEHTAAGIAIGESIRPLDAGGAVAPVLGRIVMISVGMSNAAAEFSEFVGLVDDDLAVNPRLVLVDGAQPGFASDQWTSPAAPVWDVVDQRVAEAGVVPAQVQVAWVKQARGDVQSLGGFPEHAEVLQRDLEDIAHALRVRYPNLRLAYLSSRTRAYTDDPQGLNPEPFARESAYAVRWTIERQLAGAPDLAFDPGAGAVTAPFLSWGPYLWADGLDARSDGFVWACEDTTEDFTHPSPTGQHKVAEQLDAFFRTDPTSAPWYLRQRVVGAAPTCAPSASASIGAPPLEVRLAAHAADADGQVTSHAWSFGDGTFSIASDPPKTFHQWGRYPVRVTVTDDRGNAATCELGVRVGGQPVPSAAASGPALLALLLAAAGLAFRARAGAR